ncbi:peptidase C13 family protein [Moraxella atlantae]|uniref:Peptidase C13 family protein n=1 Tax=Faucicola atlantae TaxID=34059 RepID=A0A1B8QDX7_9GAMM|nr:peptidase C13 family protein [Moraxella atlantae]
MGGRLIVAFSQLRLAPLHSFTANFLSNIRAAGYMLLGSRKAFYWVKPTIGQFFAFALTALGSNLLFAWLSAADTSAFNEQGLVSYLVWPMVMLVWGLILARRHYNAMLIYVPAILWLVADTMMALLQSLFQWLGHAGWLPEFGYIVLPVVFTLLFVWQALSLLWVFGRQLHWSWLERVLVMVAAFAVFAVWQKNVQSQPIFMPKTPVPMLSEQALYAQPELLRQTLDSLQAERKGVTDWYFIGVAGFAEQDVFAHEIEQARQLAMTQLGMAGRTAVLVNNIHTQDSLPIASKTSLDMALQAVASRMNPSEDVLWLTVSSHGAPNVIQMQNPPIALDDLDPAWLRQRLDKAGIRWRVIVLSACYSGSFIQQLASPTTLIITASAADRASFGCTNDADFTYFGQAFFGDSLPKYHQFAPAFNDAKQLIAKREAKMGFAPSNPQWVIGKQMQARLPMFEKALVPSLVSTPTGVTAAAPNHTHEDARAAVPRSAPVTP